MQELQGGKKKNHEYRIKHLNKVLINHRKRVGGLNELKPTK